MRSWRNGLCSTSLGMLSFDRLVLFHCSYHIWYAQHVKAVILRTHLGMLNGEHSRSIFLELRITLEKNSLLPVFTGCGQCVSSATDLMLLSSAGIFLCFRWINHALAIQSVFTLMWTHRLCFFFALTCSHLLPQYQCGTNCFLHNSIHPCLWSLKLNYSEIMWPWLMDATDCPLDA